MAAIRIRDCGSYWYNSEWKDRNKVKRPRVQMEDLDLSYGRLAPKRASEKVSNLPVTFNIQQWLEVLGQFIDGEITFNEKLNEFNKSNDCKLPYLLKEILPILPGLLFEQKQLKRPFITVELIRHNMDQIDLEIRAKTIFISNTLNFLACKGLFEKVRTRKHIKYVPTLNLQLVS